MMRSTLSNNRGAAWMWAVGILGGLAFLVLSAVGWYFSVQNTGVSYEEQISAQYADNQNEMSKMISTFYETVGVANLKSAKMDTILTHAVQGRYGEEGFKAGGAFFAAVTEAYPNLDLSIYDKIVDQVTANREAFAAKQTVLREQIRSYNTWRRQAPTSFLASALFPSDALEARAGGQTLATGDEALRKMGDLIVTGSTVDAYTTGVMEPMSATPR